MPLHFFKVVSNASLLTLEPYSVGSLHHLKLVFFRVCPVWLENGHETPLNI